MPNKIVWVKPERFLRCKGLDVFHTYRDDDIEDKRTYWFTMDEDNTDTDSSDNHGQFDVRELETWTPERKKQFASMDYTKATDPRRLAIREAIDKGLLDELT